MTGSRRRLALSGFGAVASLCLLSLAPVSSGLAAPQAPDPKTAAVAAAPADNDTIGFRADQQAASDAIRDELAKLPTDNGGLSANGPGQVTIHLLGGHLAPSTAVQALMTRAEAAGVTVTVDQVSSSTAQLNQLDSAACGSNLFAKIRITECAVDPDTNSVMIGVEQPTAALRQAIADRFGDAVRVVQQSEAPLAAGRLSDTPAFVAGDAWGYVDNTQTTTHCTTGFVMTDQFGSDYIMTAGHCFGADVTGVIERTASSVNGGVSSINTQQVGVEYYTQYHSTCLSGGAHNCYDGAIAKGQSYVGDSWIGGPITNSIRGVSSALMVNPGTNVYFSGSVTGQQLGKTTGPRTAERTPTTTTGAACSGLTAWRAAADSAPSATVEAPFAGLTVGVAWLQSA